jgi:hypothetical protein
MKTKRILLLTSAAGALLAAGGCLFSTTSPPIESAGAALDRDVMAAEIVNQWWDLSARAARRLMDEYGVPDEVDPNSLAWNHGGPWRRTVVRNVAAPVEAGKDFGIIEQTVGYAMTPAQAAAVADFDARLAYDPKSLQLSARSDREELNFLRLNLADDVAHERLTPEQAREAYYKTQEFEAAGKTSPDLLALRLTR